MKKFEVEVVYSYWQVMEVDADSEEEAKATALDWFNIDQANQGDGEVYIFREVKEGESK